MVSQIQIVPKPKPQSAVFKDVDDIDWNTEEGVIPAGAQCNGSDWFDVGTVLGKIGRGATSVGAPIFTGTGNGTLTLANPAAAGNVLGGKYTVEFFVAAAGLGDFTVYRPDGAIDGYGEVGHAYDGQVKFTIAAGGVDFAVEDNFVVPVTVAKGSDKYVQLNPAATDGSQQAAGVIFRGLLASALADAKASIANRGPMVLVGDNLVWPSGIAPADQAAAVDQLAGLGLRIRYF